MAIDFTPLPVTLRDGTPILIRVIEPTDAPLLQAGFAQLSPLTIYLRFLSMRRNLSDAEALELATVDGQQRMALVAEWQDGAARWIIGVARYGVIDVADPTTAEIAVVVGDPFQGRGLGSILMEQLTRYARAHGIQTWLAQINPSNARVLQFVQRSGLPLEKHLNDGLWHVRMTVAAAG